MFVAQEYAFLTPACLGVRSYGEVCLRLDLDRVPSGYGALLCRDEEDRPTTMLTADVDYLQMVVNSVRDAQLLRTTEVNKDQQGGISVDSAKFPLRRSGDLAAVLDEHRLRGRRRRGLRRGCGVAR